MSTRIRGTETDIGSVKERFGGIDTPAALAGFVAIIGTLVLSAGIAGAIGIGYQLNAIDIEGTLQDVEVVGAIVATLVVFGAAFVGGWVAARVARFDGVMNGIGSALWLLAVVAVLAALGAFVGQEYNLSQALGLPDWIAQISADDVGMAALVVGIVGIVMLFVGTALGGAVGNAYNRKLDAAMNDSRGGYVSVVDEEHV